MSLATSAARSRLSLPPTITRLIDRRLAGHPAWVVVLELFLGLGWLRAAVEKIIAPEWWRGEVIIAFATEKADLTLPWYAPVIEHIIAPTVEVVALATIVLQLTIGLSLLTGYRLAAGLFLAIALNVNIIVAGGVNPSIFYLIMQGALVLWLFERYAPTPATKLWLKWVALAAALVALAGIPFVQTIEPKDVIEDPGSVLATFGMCMGAGCAVAWYRWNGGLVEPEASHVPAAASKGV